MMKDCEEVRRRREQDREIQAQRGREGGPERERHTHTGRDGE